MRNYIILNGKNSNQINGLLIQELPPISKPLIRTETEEIDGRDGDIVTPLGYSAYDKELTIGLYKDFDVNEVAAYFNSEGTVIFSNEPDKYYYYQITAQIDFERLVRYRTATVTMHCQPFKYSATEQPITEDVSGTVSDEGTNLALENTAEAPFNTLDLKGNTSQQTYTGKNLFNYTNPTASTSGLNTTLNQDGTLTTTGVPTSNFVTIIPAQDITNMLEDGATYTVQHSDSGNYLNLQVTAPKVGGGNDYYIGTSFTVNKTTHSSYKISVVSTTTANWGSGSRAITAWYQLEKSNTATAFEPYVGGVPAPNPDYPQNVRVVTGENVVKITGKNLFDYTGYNQSAQGLTNTLNADGTITTTGVPTANYARIVPNLTITNLLEDGATYTLSKTYAAGHVAVQVQAPRVSGGVDYYLGSFTVDKSTHTSYLITAQTTTMENWGSESRTITCGYQLEKGSSSSQFEPYKGQSYPISLGSIELCGLGDDGAGGYLYQDGIYKNLTDNKWYVRKEVGKLVQNGTETGWYNLSGSTSYARTNAATSFVKNVPFFANRGLTTPTSGTRIKIPNNNLYWYETGYESIEAFKSSLATTNLIVYAPLLTPTDTEITNEALIEQLDDIYYHAHSYKGRTHITSSAATGNVPHIIAAEVGEDNESTITNAGNYLSKPKITVYGSGDISLYINDMHVLQITLGDEGYITIDTAQMEAYKDTLDNLKNRLVIGDYSNARLKPGANKIHFTGTVTKYVVENYSRWL